MKKVLFFLNVIFICSSSLILGINNSVNISIDNGNYVLPVPDNDGMDELVSYLEKGIVYENYITISNKYTPKIKIPTETLDFNTSDYKNGDIIQKGTLIDGYAVPYRLRVRKIFDDSVLVENMEKTGISIVFKSIHPLKVEDLSLSIRDDVTVKDYLLSFDISGGYYQLDIIIDNDGEILNSTIEEVALEYSIRQEGRYVAKNFVYKDEDGVFVYKVINIKGKEYAKKIYVTIMGEFNGYFLIEGELHGKNIIVKL